MSRVAICLLLLLISVFVSAAPATFREAKNHFQAIYAGHQQTFYCGCDFAWNKTTGSSGTVDLESCGYQMRRNANRAARIEAEHVLPAWWMGHQRQYWQNGGRNNCTRTDPVFSAMEADLHNLVPAIGEINGDRSNYRFGMVAGSPDQYGQCQMQVDFKERVAEPPPHTRGMIARVYFYMADQYGLSISRQQQQLLSAWHRQYPVTEWELERDARITRIMGHGNPYVTGEKVWSLD